MARNLTSKTLTNYMNHAVGCCIFDFSFSHQIKDMPVTVSAAVRESSPRKTSIPSEPRETNNPNKKFRRVGPQFFFATYFIISSQVRGTGDVVPQTLAERARMVMYRFKIGGRL